MLDTHDPLLRLAHDQATDMFSRALENYRFRSVVQRPAHDFSPWLFQTEEQTSDF